MLQLDQLTKRYLKEGHDVSALDDVSLTVSAGDFLALQGASGSGKSTLLMTAGGMLAPDHGKVLLAGHDLYAVSPNARARIRSTTIGFVFQQFHLIPFLSVRDNILAPTMASAIDHAADRADGLIDQFGLGPRAEHLPSELSTGERQRTALARALLHKPQLLLADEPTGNLDPTNATAVLDALAEFAAEGGAVLLATHHREAAERAERCLRMNAGRLEA